MSRVLVTGSEGLLGRHLVPYLHSRGHEVVCHSRSGATEFCANLADESEAKRLLDEVKAEVVVNLAALTDVDLCEREPQQAYLSNVRVVENLANWIRLSGQQAYLIQVSTDQVYDGIGSHKETDICLSNTYGFSKYAGELAALSVPSTVLRTNFFGPSRCKKRMSISDWLVNAMMQKQAVTVFDDVRFSPLSLASLEMLISIVIEQRQCGVYNLGSSGCMSKAEFAFLLGKTLKLPTDMLFAGKQADVKLEAFRPKNMSMNSRAFEAKFGVKLPTLRDEVASMKHAYSYLKASGLDTMESDK
jgi:dTDP-4-dehydrorhamnose reductase